MWFDWNNKKEFSRASFVDDDLVLYYHPNSFYSQKVLFAMYEKNLRFTAYEIDVANGEQYSSWFLELNPKGEVPVLQHGTLIVPESSRIINYIEQHFHGDKIISLMSNDTDAQVSKNIIYFSRLLSRVPVGAISMGSFIHSEFCPNPKPPFIGPVRQSLLKSENLIQLQLREHAKVNTTSGDALNQKADFHERKRLVFVERSEFIKLLEAVDRILIDVEQQLASAEKLWLCSDMFTIADVCLVVLMQRLYSLGLEQYFWTENKKPLLDNYFQQARERKTFQKCQPTTIGNIKIMWTKTPATYKYGLGVVSVSSLLLASMLISSKN